MSFALSIIPEHPFTGWHFLHAKMYLLGNISSKWLVLIVLVGEKILTSIFVSDMGTHQKQMNGGIRHSTTFVECLPTQNLSSNMFSKIKNVYLLILKKYWLWNLTMWGNCNCQFYNVFYLLEKPKRSICCVYLMPSKCTAALSLIQH